VVSFMSQPYYPQEKSPRYPSDGRLGGAQSRHGPGGEEKEIPFPLPGIELRKRIKHTDTGT